MRRRDFVKTLTAGSALAALTRINPARSQSGPLGPIETTRNLDSGWYFIRDNPEAAESIAFDHSSWEQVTLPHTARIEDIVTGAPGTPEYQWQGICWYRTRITSSPELSGKNVFLRFEGAMNVADVWVNGNYVGQHLGGYLPFVFDVTGLVRPGSDTLIAVRLDNRDNPVTGPKPLEQLDFNTYGGLYRLVRLIVKDRLYITDPIFADKTASGGLFVTFPRVSESAATVRVRVHVRNDDTRKRSFALRYKLTELQGTVVAVTDSEQITLDPGADKQVTNDLEISRPKLWDLVNPNRYDLQVEVVDGDAIVDIEQTRIGIRHFEIRPDGFRLNGQKVFLRGTNRHQEYPYIGYALSDEAQYRDALKIKEAGFDYIRLSHYPHAPAFMDACDELGLVVMDSIPGWQYFNRTDPAFTTLQYENCRRLIRRDRNHPSVILWEVSLNETDMPAEFIQKTHAIAHEEIPEGPCYSCGWTKGYDVFIQARQHGGCHEVSGIPCVVSEYGDWEYYAQNAGLNQESWKDLAPDEANSRQLRGYGEKALLQQALNFQEAHNDNRSTPAFADGLWVMYDYNRGYAPDIESSGCMDIFRLPKYSYYFFRSQRDAAERLKHVSSGPMVFIASYWTPDSARNVRVFSNCDTVELLLNDRSLGRQRPDTRPFTEHLAHPPFTFRLDRFEAGTLEAVGYINNQATSRHIVKTPGDVSRLRLEADLGSKPLAGQGKDVVFVYARLEDTAGTIAASVKENVFFGSTGPARIVGRNPYTTEAGIATTLVQAERKGDGSAVYALAITTGSDGIRLFGAALDLGQAPVSFLIRYTTDGSVPEDTSPVYSDPIHNAGLVRAGLFIGGKRIVEGRSDLPAYQMPGSKAPQN